MHRRDTQRATILLVEDNDNDVMLTREAFRAAAVPADIHNVTSGRQCLSFLRKEDVSAGTRSPDLILLDVNMPAMDGREVMAAIAGDEDLRHLCVVALSTSENENDILTMYQLGCRGYVVKPIAFDQFVRRIRSMCEYWFDTSLMPTVSTTGE
jgi:CheY-like chemotaxis protein